MTAIDFYYHTEDSNFYSSTLEGGVNVQLTFNTPNPVRVTLETRLDEDLPWTFMRTMMASESLLFSLSRYAEGQQFRVRCSVRPATANHSPIDSGAVPTDEEFNELTQRVVDIEEGNEPLVLSINPETGNLEQEGVSSGTFSIDTETGHLCFES